MDVIIAKESGHPHMKNKLKHPINDDELGSFTREMFNSAYQFGFFYVDDKSEGRV